eukprot:gene2925-3505_t
MNLHTERFALGVGAVTMGHFNHLPSGFRPRQTVEEFLYSHPDGPPVLANAIVAIDYMGANPLDRGHAIALQAYTQESPLYKGLCAALLVNDPAGWAQYADYVYHLQKAVSFLPASAPGRVYRGIDKRLSPKVYCGTVTWQAFSSTTYNPMSMAPFCGLDESVAQFSAIPLEEEALLPPNSQFQVLAHITDLEEKQQMLPQLHIFNLAPTVVYHLQEL